MANLIPRDLAGGEELLGKLMNSFWQERQMNTDIKEYEDKYLVQADLPGIKKENIRVSYVNNTLTISAAQTETTETEDDFGHICAKNALAVPINGPSPSQTLMKSPLKQCLKTAF